MEYIISEVMGKPYLHVCDSKVTKVNKDFTELTGFAMEELLGKSDMEIGEIIRISSQILLDHISNSYSGFIFTKSLEARAVDITIIQGQESNEKIYIFIEKINSRLEQKFPYIEQLYKNKTIGIAIFEPSTLILLKANQIYMDFFDAPACKLEYSIGKSIHKFCKDWTGSEASMELQKVADTGEVSLNKEFLFKGFQRGFTYWDITIIPMLENGKVMYIILTATEVTEAILNKRRIIAQNEIILNQNEQLEQQKIQLKEKNMELLSIIENLSEGIVIRNAKGEIILANQEAKRLIYQTEKMSALDEIVKEIYTCDMEGNEIPYEKEPVFRALKGEVVKNTKMLITNPEKKHYLDTSAVPIYNSDGELTMVVSSFHDITDLVTTQRELKDKKDLLESIIENMSEALAIHDKDGKLLLNNAEARKFYPNPDVLKSSKNAQKYLGFYDLNGNRIKPCDLPSNRALRGEKVKDEVMIIKSSENERIIEVSSYPVYDNGNHLIYITSFHRDITRKKQIEDALVKSETNFKEAQQIANMGSWTWDLNNKEVFWSDEMYRIFGIDKNSVEGRLGDAISKVVHPEDLHIFIEANTITGVISEKKIFEYRIVWPDNSIRYIRAKAGEVIFDDSKTPIAMSGIVFDITESVILYKQLDHLRELTLQAEKEKNEALERTLLMKDEFLVNISHELKTPLNVIYSTVQLFNMYCCNGSLDDKKDSIVKYIDSIKKNSYRLSKLVNNIVDLSKIDAGFLEICMSNNNIVEVVEEVVLSVTDYTDSKGLNIIFDTDNEENIVACDPEKIERIVLNLISNAVKFSYEGGEIFVNIKNKNDVVEISVKDNGIGIEKQHLDMIFDRYKQVNKSLSRNVEGTGIGLSLVKSIVELHEGSIFVESEYGQGSKFTVALPARKVMQENMLLNNKIRSRNESVLVEFSDID